MVIISLSILVASLFYPAHAQGTDLLWKETYDGGKDDTFLAAAVDSQDNTVVAGWTIKSDYQHTDYLIIKYGSNGKILWNRITNLSGMNYAQGITVDSQDNIIVTGKMNASERADIYTIKYDKDGNKIWDAIYDNSEDDFATDVAVDSQDNIIVVGSSNKDCLIIKYANDGMKIWNKTYGDNLFNYATGVAIDSKDNIVVAATFYNGTSSVNTTTGWTPSKYYTTKFDASGNEIWHRTFGGISGFKKNPYHDMLAVATCVAVDSHDNIIVTGKSNSSYHTIKYSTNGEEIWTKEDNYRIGIPYGVTTDSKNNIIITGTFSHADQKNSPYETSTIKYDENGSRLWIKNYFNNKDSEGMDIAVDSSDNILVVGATNLHIYGGEGNTDGLILKYKQGKSDNTPGFEIIALLTAMGVVLWLKRRR